MLLIWGLRVFFRTISEGVFHCRNCGGDRKYRLRAGRRWFTVFFIPVIPLTKVGEHVQCQTCKTRYVADVLKLPTAAQMQAALPAGMRAAATAMLQSGDPANPAARQRAVAVILGAGAQGYADGNLDHDRAESPEAVGQAIGQVAQQLTPDAKEWFLAEVIRVGTADGPLTESERNTAVAVAADLGMSPAQAIGVITLAEQPAQD
ncbi:MAG TPA: zinc ribbon domain-containing protein [Streptosporangiaceae bacterium]|nr:zinc ribbon domain-containing protein [Streptosporangiaceae bacterium]